MADAIAAVEAATYAAWPAREMVTLGEWQLRYADGFSRRANSVRPVGDPPDDFANRVEWCRRWYAERDSGLVFRMTPLCEDATEEALTSLGAAREGETIVMTADLSCGQAPSSGVSDTPTDEWWKTMAELWQLSDVAQPAWRGIIERIDLPAAHIVLYEEAEPCAAGLGVIDSEWLGLFELIVGDTQRRRGRGRAMTKSLLNWGYRRGARHAFLQVVVGNDPAIALYESLGFRELYRYSYLRL